MKKLSTFMAAALAFGAGSLVQTHEVFADASSTVGSLRGIIRDRGAKEPAAGATVVATSPALQGEQVVITDDKGAYFITSLPPGMYTLTVYYNDVTYSRGNVLIQVGKEAVINLDVNTEASKGKGEVIQIKGSTPIIDQGSTKTGVTLTDDYTRNVPVGRTFGEVVGAASGEQGDFYGASFSGSTSLENTYVVEGINTTDTAIGSLSSNLPNEFVSETEIITGGYNAEYGRSTGGIVNVATKSGSNQFHGSVFGYFSPDALTAAAKTINSGNAIDTQDNPGNAYDFGAEVGGPIIKDKLWFHVGFNPSFTGDHLNRIISSEDPCVAGDPNCSTPGVDPKEDANGNIIKHEISEDTIKTQRRTYYFTAKINGQINQNHQFSLSAWGNPEQGSEPSTGLVPLDNYQYNDKRGAWDIAGKWTSKFDEGRTQIDAIVGYHRAYTDITPNYPAGNQSAVEYVNTVSLNNFADLEPSLPAGACADAPGSQFIKCPVTDYAEGGPGYVQSRSNNRLTAALTVTERVKALGYHTIKAGVDYEGSTYNEVATYSGGAFYYDLGNNGPGLGDAYESVAIIHVLRQLTAAEQQTVMTDGEAAAAQELGLTPGQVFCQQDTAICGNSPLHANTNDRSIGAFLQDSWQIIPNFSLDFGVRYENQALGWATQLAGTPVGDGTTYPSTAVSFNNWAPRVGFIWDPTNQGKSKIFGHFGRFYENVPMDINVRSFGGEIDALGLVNATGAGANDPNCTQTHAPGVNLGSYLANCSDFASLGQFGGDQVAPGLQGQYINEYILGAEYEVLPDLKVSLTYTHRNYPTVIEDIVVNGGSYLVVNPGDNFDSQANKLDTQAMNEMASNPAQAAKDQQEAASLRQVKSMDTPTRNYDAATLQVTQRPTKKSLIIASYTYSREIGNYPGLFSTETNQADPNITSEYDFQALLANRYGPTGLDRPHNVKIDGFYQFDLHKAGLITLGGSIRAQSGIPHNVLGADPYGQGEVNILPAGTAPRSPVSNEEDIHVSYGYRLTKGITLEIFADIFNLFNQQQQSITDENYTLDNVHPIVGGDSSDLVHLKTLNSGSTQGVNATPTLNPDYGKTAGYLQAPRTFRFGFRLTF